MDSVENERKLAFLKVCWFFFDLFLFFFLSLLTFIINILKVKEPCVELSRLTLAPPQRFDPESRELANRLQKLYEALQSIKSPETVLDDKFADYIFFPLAQLLQKPTLGDRTTVYLQKVLGFLIQYAWSQNIHPELAKQFFILITFLIGGTPQDTSKKNSVSNVSKSDESKAAGCAALIQLFSAIENTPSVGQKFRTDITIIPTVGHAVSTFLDCALTGINSLDLQKSSLEALDKLLFHVIKFGDPLASMLPGIISTLTKILVPKHGARRHYTVYVSVFKILQQLLEIVFNDQDLNLHEKAPPKSVEEISKSFSNNSKEKKNDQKIRTNQWLKASKEQVKIALSVVPSFRMEQMQQRPEIQAAMIEFSFALIKSSPISLNNCIPMFLDNIMLIISQDSQSNIDPIISRQAKLLLENAIERENESKSTGLLIEALQERVFDWIDSLPRLLTSHDDTQAKGVVSAINSGITILSKIPDLSQVNGDGGVGMGMGRKSGFNLLLEKLINLIQDSIKMAPSEKLLPQIWPSEKELTQNLIESGKKNNTMLSALNPSKTKDVSFSDFGLDVSITPNAQEKLSSLITSLGVLSPSSEIIRQLLEQVNDQSISSPQTSLAAWLAVNCFEGMVLEESVNHEVDNWLTGFEDDEGSNSYNSTLSKVAKEDLVVEMYSFCLNQISGSISSLSSDVVSKPGYERFQDVLTGNALRGLSLVARYMGKDFRHQLMDVLYPLIDLLGTYSPSGQSSSGVIRVAAQQTLMSIAKSCEYDNVRHMIISNYDYVVDSLSLKLNTLDFSPQGPLSLSTIISVSGPQILPYLDDVVASLFAILDNFHGYKSIVGGIFTALDSIVNETRKGYAGNLKYSITNGEDVVDSNVYKNFTKDSSWRTVPKNGIRSINSPFKHVESFEELLDRLDRKPVAPDLSMKEQFEKEVKEEEEEEERMKKDGNSSDHFQGNKKYEAHPGKPFAEVINEENEKKSTKDEGDLMEFNETDVDPTTSMETPQEKELSNWISPVPKPTWELIKQIVEYSDKFLLHDSALLRRQLLDLVKTALPILASASANSTLVTGAPQVSDSEIHEDKSNTQGTKISEESTSKNSDNEELFFPIINDIWPVLIHTLDDEDSHISQRALDIIVQIVILAGDFMSTRIVLVWPKIKSFLGRGTISVGSGYSTRKQQQRLVPTTSTSFSNSSVNVTAPTPTSTTSTVLLSIGTNIPEIKPSAKIKDTSTTEKKNKDKINVSKNSQGTLAGTRNLAKNVTTELRYNQNRNRNGNPMELSALEFVAASVSYAQIEQKTFSDMLITVGPYLELAKNNNNDDGKENELAQALKTVNADAVWFEITKRNQELWPKNPELIIKKSFGEMKPFKHLHEFVSFSV